MAAERVRTVILDSNFLVAWHNTSDVHHAAAARAMVDVIAGRWGRALLLEYVFLEVVTVLMSRRGLDVARMVGDTLLAAADLDFVPCSAIFVDAFETFRAQARPDLSFADAAIATVARRQLAAVATFDRGFRAHTDLKIVPA